VVGGWRKLHNEELHNLYSSPNIIRTVQSRRMRWLEHVAPTGENRNPYKISMEKTEGKSPLGRNRHRWKNNTKIDFGEIDVVVWTGFIWLRMGTSGKLL
jgi:hypothetical protein